MHKPLAPIGIAGILAIALSSAGMAGSDTSVLLTGMDWQAFAGPSSSASLAWSGEDETFATTSSLLGKPRQAVQYDESVVDPELLTGLPAPEPPALVLAGMAFGGVLCGRSLLMRRRRAEADATDEDSKG